MKSCGVIAEYNPFHNGHKYQLEQARKQTNADVIIVVMSGNFVQRGEPAIIDKWERTKCALTYGADLVIELPTASVLQSADLFSASGVAVLHALHCDFLCFGTEDNQQFNYEKFAKASLAHQKELDECFQQVRNTGKSYPAQMEWVYQQVFPNWTMNLSSPNHLLGMTYAKANQKYAHPMKLIPLVRKKANHEDQKINHSVFASGSAVRKFAQQEQIEQISTVVPPLSLACLKNNSLIDVEKLWPFVHYQLLISSISELKKYYQMNEGIEYRLKKQIAHGSSWSNFVQLIKTKRFTWTRIQRLLCYSVLKMTEAEIQQTFQQPYIRVLGMNEVGKCYLNQQKKQLEFPLITNVNQKNASILQLDIKAGELYNLLKNEKASHSQDYYRHPLILKNNN